MLVGMLTKFSQVATATQTRSVQSIGGPFGNVYHQ